jgi:hypothetical protein
MATLTREGTQMPVGVDAYFGSLIQFPTVTSLYLPSPKAGK